MPTEIELDDAGRFFMSLARDIRVGAARALYLAGLRGVQKIKSQIIPSREPQPVDRGVYRAGWRVRTADTGLGVWIENTEPHAIFIEEGVRGENIKIGRAMIDALAEWAMRKGIADDEDEAVGIAWGIANKMKSRGIFNQYEQGTGLHILGELMDMHIGKILQQEIIRETKRAINDARR